MTVPARLERHMRERCRLLACLGVFLSLAPRGQADLAPLNVRITSPLGRAGVPGPIRIVAQVRNTTRDVPLQPVRFYVDDTLLGEDTDGPPYALPWIDENPFEPRTLRVEVADEAGRAAHDAITLEPFEIYEEARVASVLLEASVTDKQGRYVTGMGSSGFILEEDEERQELSMVRSDTLPATYALLIDTSQSMSGRIELVKDTARRLAQQLKPGDQLLVVPFTQTLGAITGPTDDLDTVSDAIGAIDSVGGTAIADAIGELARMMSPLPGRHAIVLLTDGYDEHSRQTLRDALETTRHSHSTLFVIGIGGVAGISLRGEKMLREVAGETGGRVFFPTRISQVAEINSLIATDVENRYLMAYTPNNQALDGAWRAISLRTVDSELTVRTRPGYFAPSPPPIRASLELTMTDRERQFVEVAAEDLIVVENGLEQPIESFQESVSPVSIVLALDSSGSMRRSADVVKEAARQFVKALGPDDKLALALFADRPEFAHELAMVREPTLESIDRYQALGGTALYDTIADALLRLRQADGRRVLVVMTDGRDEDNSGTGPGSTRTYGELEPLVRESGAALFTIGLGVNVDQDQLTHLAEISGGEALFPAGSDDLESAYRRIIENLRRRWVLTYTSTNRTRDGEWRKVDIRVRRPELHVQSVGGYFAPAK